ncbi:MAG: hypothetical protein Q8R28_13530, partial [Dehalococcoidia bacterium]|nr:hypothetical protein [Dehalococcoidia bacterium]
TGGRMHGRTITRIPRSAGADAGQVPQVHGVHVPRRRRPAPGARPGRLDRYPGGRSDDKLVAHVWRQRSRYYEGYLACDKYGHSLDRGHRDQRRFDARAPLYTGDDGEPLLEPMVLEAVSGVRSPARLALFKVAYQRFLASLSPDERRYWQLRAAGYGDRSFCCHIWRQEICTRMKRRMRERFRAMVES